MVRQRISRVFWVVGVGLPLVLGSVLAYGAVERDWVTESALRDVLREDYASVSPAQREKRIFVSKLAEQTGVMEQRLFVAEATLAERKRESRILSQRFESINRKAQYLPAHSGLRQDLLQSRVTLAKAQKTVAELQERLAQLEGALANATRELTALPQELSPIEKEANLLPELESARRGEIPVNRLMKELGVRFAFMTTELNLFVDPPPRRYNAVVRDLIVTLIAAMQVAHDPSEAGVQLRSTLPAAPLAAFSPYEASLYVGMMTLGWHLSVWTQDNIPPPVLSFVFGVGTALRGAVTDKWPVRSREQIRAVNDRARSRAAIRIFLENAVSSTYPELPRRFGMRRQLQAITDYIHRSAQRYGVAACTDLLVR